jgi:hypothetical protein
MEPRPRPASSGPARASKEALVQGITLRHAAVKKGGPTAALLFALTLLGWPRTAAADIPWGAGCVPLAEDATRTAANCGASLEGGEALPPPEAPAAVKRVIRAERDPPSTLRLGRRPRQLGQPGYDCSGAVSYALHGAGLLDTTMSPGSSAVGVKRGQVGGSPSTRTPSTYSWSSLVCASTPGITP